MCWYIYVCHRGYSGMLFLEFVYDFECTLFAQPYHNPHSAQNDTQMEYIWVSHETERIDVLMVPFAISKHI